jgi:hypothetical protein
VENKMREKECVYIAACGVYCSTCGLFVKGICLPCDSAGLSKDEDVAEEKMAEQMKNLESMSKASMCSW